MNPDTITPPEIDMDNLDISYVEVAVLKTRKDLLAYFGKDPARTRNEFNTRSRQLFAALVLRDGPACKTCGSIENPTVDHIIAIENGGTNEMDNLQILCKSCNSRKGARL